MQLSLYQVDAFTDTLFGGNPAAVIPLQEWLSEKLMQQLALENNLSETVFFVPAPEGETTYDYHIRWFTPTAEINLCGHATLASAWVLFNILGHKQPTIRFHCKSGLLTITRQQDIISMDFPAWKPLFLEEVPEELSAALNHLPFIQVYKYRDYLVELENEEAVRQCQPDFTLIKQMGEKVIITARGANKITNTAGSHTTGQKNTIQGNTIQQDIVPESSSQENKSQQNNPSVPSGAHIDFVSRFFAPTVGVNEDPVTGSAHSQLIPYWAEKLGKSTLRAKQLSRRGGDLWCQYLGDRVTIAGKCVFFMKGEIRL